MLIHLFPYRVEYHKNHFVSSFFFPFFFSFFFFSLSLFSPRAINLNKYDRRSAIASNERGKCLKGLGLFLFK